MQSRNTDAHFHTIHNGRLVVNLKAISHIQLFGDAASVIMSSGVKIEFTDEDFADLMDWVNARHE